MSKSAKKGAAPEPADNEDVKNSAYVRAALEATVTQLKARVRELTEDVETLRSTRGKISSETQEFVAYATAELKAKDDIISELRARIQEIETARDNEIKRLQAQMETVLEISTSERRSTEKDLREKLADTEMKLEKANSYFERREELENKIDVLQATLDEERASFKRAFQDLERKYLLEKAALLKEHQAAFAEVRKQAKTEAQKSLDADTQRIIMENRQLSDELSLQIDESRGSNKEKAAMTEQNKLLQREVDLFVDKEKEWARQGALKSQEIRASQARIKELETALSMEKADKEMTRQLLIKQSAKQNEELRLELDGLRSLVRLKNKELGTIKRLAAVILKQRTEVETFFLEALSEVKAEIAARKKAAATLTANSLKTPLDRSGIGVAVSPMRAVGSSSSAATNATGASGMMTPQSNKTGVRGLPPSAMAGLAGRTGPLVSPPNPMRPAAMTISLPEGAASLPQGTTLPALVQHGTKGTNMAIGSAGAAAASAFGMGFALGTPAGVNRPPLINTPTPLRAVPNSSSSSSSMDGSMDPPLMGGKISPAASLRLAPGTGSGIGGPNGMLVVDGSAANNGNNMMMMSRASGHSTGMGAMGGMGGGGFTAMQQAINSIGDDGLPMQPLTAQQRRQASMIDISELLPDDRMKVLRLLFAKIHHVAVTRAAAAAPTPAGRNNNQRERSPVPSGTANTGSSMGFSRPPNSSSSAVSSTSSMMMPPSRATMPPHSAASDASAGGVSLQAPFGLSADIPDNLREATHHQHHHDHDHDHHQHGTGAPDIDPDAEARIQAYLKAEGAALMGLSQLQQHYQQQEADQGNSRGGYLYQHQYDENGTAQQVDDGEGGEDDEAAGETIETEKLADSLIQAVSEREALSRRLAAEAARGPAGGGRR